MDILDDMGVSKLSTKVFSKVNYSFKQHLITHVHLYSEHQAESLYYFQYVSLEWAA